MSLSILELHTIMPIESCVTSAKWGCEILAKTLRCLSGGPRPGVAQKDLVQEPQVQRPDQLRLLTECGLETQLEIAGQRPSGGHTKHEVAVQRPGAYGPIIFIPASSSARHLIMETKKSMLLRAGSRGQKKWPETWRLRAP